jgi:hypothetical protein
MVAINKQQVRCVIVSVEPDAWLSRGALVHDVVPGADPYVAMLIQRLQDEVRSERQAEEMMRREGAVLRDANEQESHSMRPRFEPHQLRGDLELPWFDMPWDDEPLGDGEEQLPRFGGDGNEN